MATAAAAAASAAVKNTIPKFRYLSAWFCPYAHRATIALEHHAGRIEYEWVEALGWEKRKDKNNVTGTGEEWWYHWKADELRRSNPSALVPTLIPIDETTGKTDETKAVYESIITIEYIDAISHETPPHLRLLPTHSPYLTAQCRIWSDKVNRDCCSPYYTILVRKDPQEQRDAFSKLLDGLRTFNDALADDGPTFLPEGQLSSVDVTLLPWAFRYYVLEHYRGSEFAIPREDDRLEKYWRWFDHVMDLESVKRTLPDKDLYLEHIGKYADSSARSKVANAVRRGVAAHELDDEIDEY